MTLSEARPVKRRTRRAKPRPGAVTYVAAAEFKTTCLELLDRVRETGVDYVVTKHGTPVARVVPYHVAERSTSFFGSMKGTVVRFDRPFDPIDGEYDIDGQAGPVRR